MDDLELIFNKRMREIPPDLFTNTIEKFRKYRVNYYNKSGEFDFNKFRDECQKTMKTLYKNDKPINGIRYQFCDFMSLIQTLVGIRNMNKFMYENSYKDTLKDVLEEMRKENI